MSKDSFLPCYFASFLLEAESFAVAKKTSPNICNDKKNKPNLRKEQIAWLVGKKQEEQITKKKKEDVVASVWLCYMRKGQQWNQQC